MAETQISQLHTNMFQSQGKKIAGLSLVLHYPWPGQKSLSVVTQEWIYRGKKTKGINAPLQDTKHRGKSH